MSFVFNPFFFTFMCVISYVYNAEIFPVEIRARGNSLTTVSNWCVGLIIGQTSPIALDTVGFRHFYAFFVFNVVPAICYAAFYPDTKGRTLEQMDTLFGDQVVPRALGGPRGCRNCHGGFRKKIYLY
jgi:MFS family permease